MITPSKPNYRNEIDGFRAIAVLSVIAFHMGFLPNGYLGVDIFFVISGYLITKIVYNETLQDKFKVSKFYLRRIRRIIPLTLFTSFIALLMGIVVMLPDDLENLSQSVFATNIFANNILLLITTGDYWSIVNEYKPLMHTWSLGIEEQFYLFFPIIFMFFKGKRKGFILPTLIVLALLSLTLYLTSINESQKFYLLQYRFFELAFGGIAAIITKGKPVNIKGSFVFLLCVLAVLLFNFPFSSNLKLLIVVFASIGVLISNVNIDKINSVLLENKLMVGIGKISFSLYMWHQIVLAYTRYFITDNIGIKESLVMLFVIVLLSVISYYIIEQPFRNKAKVKTKPLLITVGLSFIIIVSSSLYLYLIGGTIRDVPELSIKKDLSLKNFGSGNTNLHIRYNAKIYETDKPFTDNNKIKVLLTGNSFARDFANVLLESDFADTIEISYVEWLNNCKDINDRLSDADIIFFSEFSLKDYQHLKQHYDIDDAKVWNVGTKNFGANNGIFYNKRHNENYCSLRTSMVKGTLDMNESLKKEWGNKYIDLIASVIDKDGKVPVFTPDCKFISQDCNHFTQAGAQYFAQKLDILDLF